MFAEPERTSWDLNFRLLGFRVRVHPLFWLGAVLLGASAFEAGLHFVLIWVAVVFVSILVHEFGHALAFRQFGTNSHIVLWMFGGLAIPETTVSGRWRRIVVYLAGPFAGFLLCGLVYGSNKLFPWIDRDTPQLMIMLYFWLIMVNLYWGILNLLPVFPLDGGQVSRELCGWKWPGRGLIVSLKISVGVAVAFAVYCLVGEIDSRRDEGLLDGLPWWVPRGSLFTAILFVLLAVQSYQLLQQVSRTGGYYYEGPEDDRPPWK